MNKVVFTQQLETSLYRADIRNMIIDQYNTKTKEAYTSPLESKKKWKEWESKLINYLSKLIGCNVVLLSNMVWEKDNTDKNGDLPNFIDKTIACEPIKFNYYESDQHKVYQALP